MNNILTEIKTLLLRGNVVDLMIAVVFGNALANVIRSIVHDIVVPIFTIITKKKDLTQFKYDVDGVSINYGEALNNIVIFILTSFVLLYLFIKPFNRFIET